MTNRLSTVAVRITERLATVALYVGETMWAERTSWNNPISVTQTASNLILDYVIAGIKQRTYINPEDLWEDYKNIPTLNVSGLDKIGAYVPRCDED